jgi:hypothetical protein
MAVLLVKSHISLVISSNDQCANSAVFQDSSGSLSGPFALLGLDPVGSGLAQNPALPLLIGAFTSTALARLSSVPCRMHAWNIMFARMGSDSQDHSRHSTAHLSLLTSKSDILSFGGAAAARRVGHVDLCNLIFGSCSDIPSLDH